MRNLTLEYIRKLVESRPIEAPPRRPSPMPGRKWPTRVAWELELVDRYIEKDPVTAKITVSYKNARVHSYVGKPNRYRALQALHILQDAADGATKTLLNSAWQAEFDKQGLVAYIVYRQGTTPLQVSTPAFFAYHPHSATVEVIEAFTRPLFLKFVGGMRLYSQKAKLAQEAVDAYYEWYHTQFKRRLRRPKPVPVAVIAGEPNAIQDAQQ